jgi:hypothetical protein
MFRHSASGVKQAGLLYSGPEMGLFDTYLPAVTPLCDECGEEMSGCQGKDGPCALETWREGEARMSAALRIDEPIEALDPFGVPKRFTFSCWCPNEHRRDFVGECVDGVWARTVPATARI